MILSTELQNDIELFWIQNFRYKPEHLLTSLQKLGHIQAHFYLLFFFVTLLIPKITLFIFVRCRLLPNKS